MLNEKKFLLILGHSITVHKSQGSALAYMQGDLNQSTGKKTPNREELSTTYISELLRSWNFHLEHFLSDKIYSTYSSLFRFTETNINDSPAKHSDEILDYWKDIHKNTEHGLALSYNVSKVNIIEVNI